MNIFIELSCPKFTVFEPRPPECVKLCERHTDCAGNSVCCSVSTCSTECMTRGRRYFSFQSYMFYQNAKIDLPFYSASSIAGVWDFSLSAYPCPSIRCAAPCPRFYVYDDDGCLTCQCAAERLRCPLCLCPVGSQVQLRTADRNGCPQCECSEIPGTSPNVINACTVQLFCLILCLGFSVLETYPTLSPAACTYFLHIHLMKVMILFLN